MQIKEVSDNDPILKDVIFLGKKNAKTLGMFPEGAFIDHARKKCIIAAIDHNKLLGYILFRFTQTKRLISIAHLCIDEKERNKGIAKLLLNFIKIKYQNIFRGISLSCRKDYIEASRFYENNGFKALNEVRSRSKELNYLVKWYYDFGNEDLFSFSHLSQNKTNILLDANIIVKLRDSVDNAEIMAMNADWLIDEVDFFYAPEIYNEINRDSNKTRANETRKFISNFKEARFKPEDRDNIFNDLKNIIVGENINDISDKKQISECIASGIEYFITTDKAILNVADFVFDKFSLRILNPSEFIIHIDQIKNKSNYASIRLAGANFEYKQPNLYDLTLLESTFTNHEFDEKTQNFRSTLNNVIGNLKFAYFKTVINNSNKLIGLIAGIKTHNQLNVHLLRVSKDKIANTLFHQLISTILRFSVDNNLNQIIIYDNCINEIQNEILLSFGFEKINNQYSRLTISGQYETIDLLSNELLINNSSTFDYFKEKIKIVNNDEKNELKLQLERKLWPVKITDIEIPIYIIPIKPYWASELFDYHNADQTLFGARPELTWHRENVYYRNVKPVSEQYPARILWYISSESNNAIGRHKGIIATSYLDEVHIGTAKNLFQKFRNYGIYEWKDVFKTCNNDPNKEIKVLKFSDTEVFKRMVTFNEIAEIFISNGKPKNTFTSPVKVSTVIFNTIYKIAKEK